MANVKYKTEEERRAAHKAQMKAWRLAHKDGKHKVRNTKKQGVWANEVYKIPGLSLTLGSVDKSNPTTVFLEGHIIYGNTQSISAVRSLESCVRSWFINWLKEQEEYDRKNYILVTDAHDKSSREFGMRSEAKWKHLQFELHLKKIGRSFNWVETVAYWEPIIKDIQEYVRTTTKDSGLNMQTKTGLTEYSCSVASEPDAS